METLSAIMIGFITAMFIIGIIQAVRHYMVMRKDYSRLLDLESKRFVLSDIKNDPFWKPMRHVGKYEIIDDDMDDDHIEFYDSIFDLKGRELEKSLMPLISTNELNEAIEMCLSVEDYEQAQRIQNEIDKRESNDI